MTKRTTTALFALLITGAAGPTFAQNAPESEPETPPAEVEDTEAEPTEIDEPRQDPVAFHVPIPAAEGGEDLRVFVTPSEDWKLDQLSLVYRRLDEDRGFETVAFKRAGSSDFIAMVPGRDMQPPGVEYYIESTGAGGLDHFASQAQPHRVVVVGETDYTREQTRLARHDGNRSEFGLYGEFTMYGPRAYELDGDSATVETEPYTDWFWATNVDYTYRFLDTLYAINFGVGVIRGSQDTVEIEGVERRVNPVPGLDAEDLSGMNYGWGGLTLELHELFSMDARLLLGASAVGFAAGVGGTLRIGEIANTRLEIGGEAFQDIGNYGFMFFHWHTIPRLPMALGIELTNRPNPFGATGSRVIYDIGFEVTDSIGVRARVGNVLRTSGTAAGWMGGLQTTYAF